MDESPQGVDLSPGEGGDARDRLVQAVMRLLPDHPLADLTVREIAGEAGVNHGLVHRHFGSKEALVREAITRSSEQILATDPGGHATAWSWKLMRDRPEIARLLARVCLDGPKDLLPLAVPTPARMDEYVAPIRRALERYGLGHVDPYLINAFACASLLGFVVFRPLLDAGWKLPPDADQQLDRLAPLLDAFMQTLDE